MTRRKRIKISGNTPAEQKLVDMIEQHLAIPLHDGVPGERVICTADIKQTAWAKRNMPKALREVQIKPRSVGVTTIATNLMQEQARTLAPFARQAWVAMLNAKTQRQQELAMAALKEQYESVNKERSQTGEQDGDHETLDPSQGGCGFVPGASSATD